MNFLLNPKYNEDGIDEIGAMNIGHFVSEWKLFSIVDHQHTYDFFEQLGLTEAELKAIPFQGDLWAPFSLPSSL